MMKPRVFKSENVGDDITGIYLFLIFYLHRVTYQIHDPKYSNYLFWFGLLMLTACFSYLPYTQIWILIKRKILG
jgi:hypothetical protein